MDDTMDDEYVAELLTREARESSQRYQTTGSYMSRRYVIAPLYDFLSCGSKLASLHLQTCGQCSQTKHPIPATSD